ncbi:MAG: hypothetical protein JNJ54_17365 [Myxococcaceae bacterium]|nr:hypothetical protein [Myxococcaceae bacterium]
MIRTFVGLVSAVVLIAVPTLTVWLASSLVAFHGGPEELALAGGLLLFPLLPLLWEWRATRAWKLKLARRKQFVGTPRRTLSPFARLALRTLVICLAFSGGMVARFPKVTFAALATRGDWFLEPGAQGEPWRGGLLALAGGLEGLHRLANPNPYVTKSDGDELAKLEVAPTSRDDVRPGPATRWRKLTDDERALRDAARPPPAADAGPVGEDDDGQGSFQVISWKDDEPAKPPPPPAGSEDAAPEQAAWSTGGTHWPWKAELSATVAGMHPHDETSIAAVAEYIRTREPNPYARVKALHDWVVTRLEYDHDSLKPGQRKPQDANSVFSSRVGVCEGYARLLVALGKATGDQIVYLGGDVREDDGRPAPFGHAWNAAKLEGRWYLIDPTWDDPVDQANRSRSYSTDYLFIPPSIAIFDHFPDDRRWQLLEQPLTRAEFLRQPQARPGLAREGLTLKEPGGLAVETDGSLELRLDNPLRRYVMVNFSPDGSPRRECSIGNEPAISSRCEVPSSGSAEIFTNDQREGTYQLVAKIGVRRR